MLSKSLPFLILTMALLTVGCTHMSDGVAPRYTYHEFDTVSVYYKTADTETYRDLLPSRTSMPAEPMVMAFVDGFKL